MPSVIEILEGAYGTSKKNQPTELADEAVELTQVVFRSLSGMYAIAARFNPYYFGVVVTTVPSGGAGWVIPTGALVIPLVETVTGVEVDIVPWNERASADLPAIAHLGNWFRPVGGPPPSPDPASESIDIYYSKAADEPADENATIDVTWPEQFDDLLVHEVAVYLSLKDNRPEEIQGLMARRDQWLAQYISHLTSFVPHQTSAFSNIKLHDDPRLVPLGALVAGGTGLEL